MIGGGVWFALDQSGSDLWQLLIVVGISLFFAPAYAAQRIIHKARQIENEEKETNSCTRFRKGRGRPSRNA